MSLRGKTLFISGASRGIGLAIALRAARDGANVAIVAKTIEAHPKLPGTIHTARRRAAERYRSSATSATKSRSPPP
jgi:citronellol/citronellal dehydrogenase